MFSNAVYTRGGTTVAALWRTIGDRAFFKVLRAYASGHRYGNATTAQFIAITGLSATAT